MLIVWLLLYAIISLYLPVCLYFNNVLEGWVAKRKKSEKVGRDEKSLGSAALYNSTHCKYKCKAQGSLSMWFTADPPENCILNFKKLPKT